MIRASHDPYSVIDRFPRGARPAGSVVCLRVTSPDAPEKAWVRLWRGGGEEWVSMKPVSRDVYEAQIYAGNDAGLVWYYFVLETASGERTYVGKPEGGRSQTYDHEPPSFQITVYDPAFTVPGWMHSSVMMQIMVDRFAVGSSGVRPPAGRGAFLHENWSEPPVLCQNGDDREAVDFFGGNLEGVCEKLDFLSELGVGALYLNPIFQARSNHKYDTGDYRKIDPSFGTESDFTRLTREAAERGIHVVLDGVFSHTGADSRYFNKFKTYRSRGAYSHYKDSPYYSWYRFKSGRDDYDCWWGIDTLPNINEMDPSFFNFIISGKDSVVAHYLKKGASGWRLDVADELPMEFIRALRSRVKAENGEACVIGEVWEDISNKISYGRPRSYALGDTLDSAMNYPLRGALISFLLGKSKAGELEQLVNHQLSTLPRPMLYAMMNLLGSHDKPRIIDVLAGKENLEPPREKRRFEPLGPEEYQLGKQRFVKVFEFLCHLPGMPCLYYGDDAGLTGMGDPFCRRTYPWGREDRALREQIGQIVRKRNASQLLTEGECMVRALDDDRIELRRSLGSSETVFTLDRRV